MVQREVETALRESGYRFCSVKPEDTGVFYKYYQEGFHVVIAVDFTHGYQMTVEQHRIMEERVKSIFFHPQGTISDFPDGFPVYHVEVLTLLLGENTEQLRTLCAQCPNTWAYLTGMGQLLIYENQPGDFWGLRRRLEETAAGGWKADAGSTGSGTWNRGAESTGSGTWNRGAGSTGSGTWNRGAESTGSGDWNDAADDMNGRCRKLKQSLGNIRSLPYITISLVVINVLVFLVLEFMGDTEDGLFIASHGGMHPDFILYSNQWWRIFTAGFIHFGMEHLLNNMVILCCVGSRLERTIGHWRTLLVYLLSEIGGGLLSYVMMLHTGDYAVSAGASGAVFGIIGGLLWAVIKHRGRLEGMTTKGLVFMIVLSLYFGFTASGVDNWAHIGGILVGFVSTAILYHRTYQKS